MAKKTVSKSRPSEEEWVDVQARLRKIEEMLLIRDAEPDFIDVAALQDIAAAAWVTVQEFEKTPKVGGDLSARKIAYDELKKSVDVLYRPKK
jgi:hypothetical protein